ncbi:hypothetical protein [Arthrobacter cryoconiti]|uniref:Uncharacterized protein n=1 Tax=Arthrobacter cryoconiti TaxID=748907 RepID=A0ABV8QXX2_9MICC|nr:hypothetical protein [Arthrobacter cryoconiti]MCC9067662.1 hypothetical protein [Arthrobacter cryoconiti]
MAHWQESIAVWGPAWSAVRGLSGEMRHDDVSHADALRERLVAWPDAQEQATTFTGSILTLATEEAAASREFAAGLGLKETSALVLLSARTDDLDLSPSLPADANIAEAPMEDYDAVEVALFDRPVADGRIKLEDGLAVLGQLRVAEDQEELVGVFEQAMVAVLGDEAFQHGADVLYLVADPAQAERFAKVDGWSKVAELLSFSR